MTAKVAVTKADAEKVLAAVKKEYAAYLDPDLGPVLVKDWEYTIGGGPTPYAVIWEGGPYEWAVNFNTGDVDEELALLGEEFGITFGPKPVVALPDDVFIEPITGWALGIYQAIGDDRERAPAAETGKIPGKNYA